MASKLARFHAMKPPLPRDGCIRPLIIRTVTNNVFEKLNEKRDIFRKYNCKALLKCDLKSEVDWVLHLIESSDSPIVFSHNDFRFCNNLVTEEDKQIIITDFELSAYFNRGYDFGSFFNGFDKKTEKFEFKDDSIIKEFISCYVREGEKIFGKQYSENEINSVDHIFMETKVFSMVDSLFLISCFLDNTIWKLPITEKTCLVITFYFFKSL